MTLEQESRFYEYLESLKSPLEQYFFTDRQKQEIARNKAKLESSRTFVSSIINQEDFEQVIQKAVAEGRIFSPSEASAMNDLFSVIEDGNGARIDIQQTLINKSGQCIIMSGSLLELLGFIGDGYITNEEMDDLVGALQADGVPGPEIDRVIAALNKYGTVVLQNGVYVALMSMLEDAVGVKITNYIPNSKPVMPTQAVPQPQTKLSEELPAGFIEYLKNNDKGFDRIENEVMNDSNFIAFFDNLKNHYDSYKKLPADRMAHEIMLRPALWSKLSPPTQASVQELVEKHRANFQGMVKEVASASGLNKLEELKKNLSQ